MALGMEASTQELDATSSIQAGVLGAIIWAERAAAANSDTVQRQVLHQETVAKVPAALDMADVSTAVASDTASPPLSPGSASCDLLSCPWHDAMSYFLTSSDLGRVSSSCNTFRTELTVEAPRKESEASRRLLVVPVVELRNDTAEAELDRVSLSHVHVLRVWSRLSLVAAAQAAQNTGKEAFRSLDKFSLKGCPLNGFDVKELLVPMLASTKRLQLLNMEKCQLVDAPVQQLCASGMLNRVETLNLRFNQIGDRGATAIAQCKAFQTMKWVNLKVNRVSDVGALALAAALRHNKSMTLLNLRKQFPALTDKSAKGFAEMLQTNSTLQQLRLRRNRISDAGAVMLATAAAERLPRLCSEIPFCDDVRLELDLEENRIGDAGALALLRTANAAPQRARVEILLSGNAATRDSLFLAVAESGESLDASDSRVIFATKPEYDL